MRAQLLDRRPTELLDVVCQLTLLQIDPTAAIAPNADLVAWSRPGSSYAPAQSDTALVDRTLLEFRAMIRPSETWPCTGPLPSRDLPDTCKVPWKSSGWTNNRFASATSDGCARWVSPAPEDRKPRSSRRRW